MGTPKRLLRLMMISENSESESLPVPVNTPAVTVVLGPGVATGSMFMIQVREWGQRGTAVPDAA